MAFLYKYRSYFLPALLAVLLVVAISKPPQESLSTSAHRLENLITDAQNSFDKICLSDLEAEKALIASSRIKTFIFARDRSLLLYNDNKIYPPFDPILYQPEAIVDKLKNGWYLQLRKPTVDGHIALGFVLLKHEYRFENKFLKNEYDVGFKIPANYNISETDLKGSVSVHSREGKVLFSLYADDTHIDNDANIALVLVYLLILLILGYYLNEAATVLARTKGPLVGFIFLIAVAVPIRYWMAYLKFPTEFYKLDLFNPSLYGSNLLAGSLGDLILSCTLVFWLAAFYYSLDSRFSLSLFSRRWKKVEQIFLISLQFVASGIVYWIFKSLVVDSVISFEVYNVLSLNQYSIFGLACISLIIMCHFMMSINAFRRLIDLDVSFPMLVIGTLISGAVFVLVVFETQFWESITFTAVWSLFFCLIGFRIFKNNSAEITSPGNSLIFILLYSVLSMFLIENCYEIKERNKRSFMAEKLISGHDYVAEFTFDDIAQRISTDKFVKNSYTHYKGSSRDLHDRISSLYFSGYFSKYDLKVFVYDSFGHPLSVRDTVPYAPARALMDTGKVTRLKPDFIYINDSLTNSSYLCLIPLSNDYKLTGIIALYLSPKIYNGQNVYPELLLGQNITSSLDNSQYNFAIYHNDRLIVQHGDYPYPYYWDRKMQPAMNKPEFIETPDWEHLIAKYSNNKSIIISITQEGFFEPVATTSYFFIIYSIIVLLILSGLKLYQLIRSNAILTDEINMSFRARINYSMLFIIIVSFAVIGSLTISFFKTQYDNYYTDRLIRKEKAILTSIEYFLQENYDVAQTDSSAKGNLGDMLGIELVKISDIHNIDINVFDAAGDLATSSQMSIFDNELISHKMDPTAFRKMAVDHETQYTQQEGIGSLRYTASYAPIRNKAGNTIAYLNVPYFEKSKTINDEVSAFLITMMNAYVFLLLCAGLMAYFISNSITRPLRFISEKLRILNLNKRNEPIEWKSKDEVGTLIAEYNKMISELESSAAKLAKSERESAWREMARQIAHEIKNPLTPMKLSIQYLQRAIDDGQDVTELAKRVNKTLIEQIDNLSSIATAFSTFAQMPKSQNEVFDLNELLHGIVGLFEKEDNVNIRFVTYKDKAMIHADRNQMISVFNNLIKNAIQSVPDGKQAEINVMTIEEFGNIKTVIMDNGNGISKESYDKVFVPNFTTKSSGTGLGLAICKQIVESMKGHIWFESTVGEGTSFFVTIPYYHSEEQEPNKT